MEDLTNKQKLILIIISSLPIAMILFFGGLIIANAQSNTLYLNNVTANLYSNNNYVTGVYSSSNYDNVWTYSVGAKWGNNIRMVNQSNLNLGHGNVVLFNMRMHYTTEDNIVFTRINSVGFSDEACYYGVNNEQGANNSSKDTYITAICFVNQDLNFNSGDNVANISFDWSNINYINVSNITIVDNEDTARSLKTLIESISGKLDTTNTRLLDINANLTAINTILSREEILLAEISSYNNYIYIVIQRIETAIGQLVGKGNDIDASINNQTTTQHNDHESMMNEDIDSTSKQNVDETKYNDYKQKEDTLMQTGANADLSGLNIGIDTGTSETIWQLITRIIQQNAKIFGLFISILSIGIIKVALAR